MDPDDEAMDLILDRLARVIASELEAQLEIGRPLIDIPDLIADEIVRGFHVSLREPDA